MRRVEWGKDDFMGKINVDQTVLGEIDLSKPEEGGRHSIGQRLV